MKDTRNGFTLMELMITVVLLGILAAFALPNYGKSLSKAHERDAINQLSSINAANSIYFAHASRYLPGTNISESGPGNTGMNANLNLNIIPESLQYCYTATDATHYTANAEYTGSGSFVVQVSQNVLSDTNPCCYCPPCPSLNNCAATTGNCNVCP